MIQIVQTALHVHGATACTLTRSWQGAASAEGIHSLSRVFPPIAMRRRIILLATMSLLGAVA
jgi:hypothetical protein